MLNRSHSTPRLDDASARAIAERAAAADRGETTLHHDLKLLEGCGLNVAPLPVDAGGHGYGCERHATLHVLDALRDVGRASLPVARLFEGHVNAVKLVMLYGTPAQRDRVAARVREGAWLGVWGADGAPPVASKDDRLTGTKRFASGLGHVEVAVVSARLPEGVRLFLVDVNDPARADASSWRVGGMRATLSGTYRFDGLPADALGEPDDYMREPFFEGGTWRYCAAHLGGAEALHSETVGLLKRMKRADDPYQAHRIARSAAALETARLWIESAAMRVEEADPDDEADAKGAAAYALLARQCVQDAALHVLRLSEDALGTIAHSHDTPVERMRRDLGFFVRQANPDGKLAHAAAALVARDALARDL